MMKDKVLSAIHKRKHTLLSRMRVKPPEPIENILSQIREMETSQFEFVEGYAGGLKAVRVENG